MTESLFSARVGLIHMGVFLVLLLSGERNFGVRLNKPYIAKAAIDIQSFTGTHADLLIIVSCSISSVWNIAVSVLVLGVSQAYNDRKSPASVTIWLSTYYYRKWWAVVYTWYVAYAMLIYLQYLRIWSHCQWWLPINFFTWSKHFQHRGFCSRHQQIIILYFSCWRCSTTSCSISLTVTLVEFKLYSLSLDLSYSERQSSFHLGKGHERKAASPVNLCGAARLFSSHPFVRW